MYYLYLHDEITGKPDYAKVGVTITPYSVIRQVQRRMVDDFTIKYLWFGHPEDIQYLETLIKDWYLSRNLVVGYSHGVKVGCQTELLKNSIDSIKPEVDQLILTRNLRVKEVVLRKPYSATKSSECPLNCPSESKIHDWAKERYTDFDCHQLHGVVRTPKNTFNQFFETEEDQD